MVSKAGLKFSAAEQQHGYLMPKRRGNTRLVLTISYASLTCTEAMGRHKFLTIFFFLSRPTLYHPPQRKRLGASAMGCGKILCSNVNII